MNIWKVLQIEKTNDKQAIKKAYRTMLKQTKPEDDEKGFMELRSAYEEALSYAEYAEPEEEGAYGSTGYDAEDNNYGSGGYDDENNAYDRAGYNRKESDYNHTGYEEEDEEDDGYYGYDRYYDARKTPEECILEEWQERVQAVYEDYTKRIDMACWEKLLYEDIPIQLKYVERCKEILYRQLLDNVGNINLPDKVTSLMDKFFGYTGTEVERAKNNRIVQSRNFNKSIKLNEDIAFEKLAITGPAESAVIDRFYTLYKRLCHMIQQWENDSYVKGQLYETDRVYEELAAVYLPYECLKTALRMKKAGEEKTKAELERLMEAYPEAEEVCLLAAQLSLYQGCKEQAAEILKDLYKKVPKNYPFVYQMAVCCKLAGMYYEAYQLVKYLTWMRPEAWQFKLADEVCDLFEEEFEAKNKESISDEDRITLCRIYLRSNRENEAAEIINEVINKSGWEYNMALCLCSLNAEETVYEPAGYKELLQYEKAGLNIIQRLEWEDLQARFLYEQKKYDESINKCNEILQEYPLSYQVLLLRSYIDYSRGQDIGENCTTYTYGGYKVFLDLNYLIPLNEDRAEARLLAACVLYHAKGYEEAMKELEELKEKKPEEYEYCRLTHLRIDKKAYIEVIEGWRAFWNKLKNRPVRVPAVSKHYLFDLYKMYDEATYLLWRKDIGEPEMIQNYFLVLEGMKESKYNKPEKYMGLIRLYRRAGKYEQAEKYALTELEKAETDVEIRKAVDELIRIYDDTREAEKAEKVYNMLKNGRDKQLYTELMSDTYYNCKEYEKIIEILLKWRSETWSVDEYVFLGRSYKFLGKYDEAREIFEEALLYVTRTGDFWKKENIYYEIAAVYKKEERLKEALKYITLGARYTKKQGVKDDYAKKYAETYTDMIWEHVIGGDIEYVSEQVEEMPEESKKYMSYALAHTYDANIEKVSKGTDCAELIEKAKEYYRKDIENGFGYTVSCGRLSYYCVMTGDYKEAREVLEKKISRHQKDNACCDYWEFHNLYHDLYKVCEAEEDWDGALECLDMMYANTRLSRLKDLYASTYAYIYRYKIWDYVRKGDTETVTEAVDKMQEQFKPYLQYAIAAAYDEYAEAKIDKGEECREHIEKAKEYYRRDIEEGNRYVTSYGRMAYMCIQLGELEEAEKILKEITDSCLENNHSGDYWNIYNVFCDLAELYIDEKRWQESAEYFELTKKYGKNKNLEGKYIGMAARVYFKLENYSKSYEIYKQWDNPPYVSLAACEFGMGQYGLAKVNFRKSIEEYESQWLELMTCVVHCEYMENGRNNPEVFEAIAAEILEMKESMEYTDDNLYYTLADIALIVNDKERSEEYVKKAREYMRETEENPDYECKSFNIWSRIYNEDYEGAYNYIESIKYYEEDAETHGLWSWLKKKLAVETV